MWGTEGKSGDIVAILRNALASGPKTTSELQQEIAREGHGHRYSVLRGAYLERLAREGIVELVEERGTGQGGGLWELVNESEHEDAPSPHSMDDDRSVGVFDESECASLVVNGVILVELRPFTAWTAREGEVARPAGCGGIREHIVELYEVDLGWREGDYERFFAANPQLVLRALNADAAPKLTLRQLADADLVIVDDIGVAWLFELKKPHAATLDGAARQLARNFERVREIVWSCGVNVGEIRPVIGGHWSPGQSCSDRLLSFCTLVDADGHAFLALSASGTRGRWSRGGDAALALADLSSLFPSARWRGRSPRWRRRSDDLVDGVLIEAHWLTRQLVIKVSLAAHERDLRLKRGTSAAGLVFDTLKEQGEHAGFSRGTVLGQREELVFWSEEPLSAAGDSRFVQSARALLATIETITRA